MSDDFRLETTLRRLEPAVRLVSERHLRKVLNYLRDRDHPVPLNAALPLRVRREDLLNAGVIPAEILDGHEPELLLITTPADRLIDGFPHDQLLREYWQLLFRAAVERKLAKINCAGKFTPLLPAVQREIRYVLESDHLASSNCDDETLFRAFASTYLTLLYFNPSAIADVFPSLPEHGDVMLVLGHEVEAESLLQSTQPLGAAGAISVVTQQTEETDAIESLSSRETARLCTRAETAERKGNFVRAAILRARAGIATQAVLDSLVSGLAAVFNWDDLKRQAWVEALAGLLAPATVGAWPRAARCLYELQKIAHDSGRTIYAIDLVECIRTLGRRPVKRPLPLAGAVAPLMHLKAAESQLVRSRLPEEVRTHLGELLHSEIHKTEQQVRKAMSPLIEEALSTSGFLPQTRIEIVAREKIVAELLDRICERGYLRFGNLRDCVARNQLKLQDLAGPIEFISGDPLLRTDTKLAYNLDGVYRRSEFYLRALHRASSAFFGTGIGRVLFLYLILPFLGAFMTVVFAEEVTHIGSKAFAFVSKIMTPPMPTVVHAGTSKKIVEYDSTREEFVWIDTDEAVDVATTAISSSSTSHSEFSIPWNAVLILGGVYLLLFHLPAFRGAVLAVLSRIWSLIRYLLWELPSKAWQSPIVKTMRHCRAMRVFHHYFSGAFIAASLVMAAMMLFGAPWLRMIKVTSSVFAAVAIGANTRMGWVVQERVAGQLADGLRLVRSNLIPGIISWVLGGFRWLANWFERRLYAIDEWLRFRGGDSQGSFALKAAIGLIWFPIAYVVRFAFYLLIEPQINPVKHFPVVTVSHKVILPMFPTVADLLSVSNETAIGILGCVPGIFGFIAWELMANWQLYRVNRPNRLKPVVIGSHGETIRGLLRPGFHSGTVPRHFRQLRKADRVGNSTKASRLHHDLDHAAEGMQRFIGRELLPLLEGSAAWGVKPLTVASLHFGCQRVVIELAISSLHRETFAFALENRDGTIEAGIVRAGWLTELDDEPRFAFVAALRGVFDMCAVGRVVRMPDHAECTSARDPRIASGLSQPWLWEEWVKHWDTDRVTFK